MRGEGPRRLFTKDPDEYYHRNRVNALAKAKKLRSQGGVHRASSHEARSAGLM